MLIEETKISLLRESLDKGRSIETTVTGDSMLPFLKEKDILLVEKTSPERIGIGDIIVYEDNGGLITHRVYNKFIERNRQYFLTKGDNSLLFDLPFTNYEVVGRIIAVKRNGKFSYLNKPLARIWGKLLTRLSFVSAWVINGPNIIAAKLKNPKKEKTLSLELGGIPLSLEADGASFISKLKNAFGNFETDKEPELRLIFKKRYSAIQKLIRRNIFKLTWKDEDFSLELPYCHTETDFEKKSIFVTAYSKHGWGDFLRFIVSILIVERGGFLLHASGVVDGNRAYVFAGPSESGKTTIARLANDRKILSDETVAVVRNNGSFLASSTPFYGEFGRITENTGFELKELYFLRKARAFEKKPLSPAEAFKNLFPNMMSRINDPKIAGRALENAAQFAEKVKCYELRFLPTPDIWRFLNGDSQD
ncbi:MAG: signal peptidase I [Candidatus Omnitrophica bacterium]|nr:signal peptidase I [Candidatus Omnitrophota bacterium]